MRRVRVIVHGRNCECKVPDCFRVNVFDGDGKDVVAAVFTVVVIDAVYRRDVVLVQEFNARDVFELSLSRAARKVFFLRFKSDVIVKRGCGCPIGDNLFDTCGDFVHEHRLDCLFFRPFFKFCNVVGQGRGKFVVLLFPFDIAFVEKEHFDVGREKIFVKYAVFAAEFYVGVRIARGRIIAFEFFSEQFFRLFVVFNQLSIGFGVRLCLFRKVFLKLCIVEICVVLMRFEYFIRGGRKIRDSRGGLRPELRLERFLSFFGIRLRAVFFQPYDFRGINSA